MSLETHGLRNELVTEPNLMGGANYISLRNPWVLQGGVQISVYETFQVM